MRSSLLADADVIVEPNFEREIATPRKATPSSGRRSGSPAKLQPLRRDDVIQGTASGWRVERSQPPLSLARQADRRHARLSLVALGDSLARKSRGALLDRPKLAWASSKMIGRTSEIAVLTPIRQGCVPGERRTYEERARALIDNLQGQHERGMPTILSTIPSIHFGRIILIRPEQYLLYSIVKGVSYWPETDQSQMAPPGSGGPVPKPIDDYPDTPKGKGPRKPGHPPPSFRSFLLTLVEFDGDIGVYFRDIAVFLARSFDQIFDNCEDFPGTEDFELFWLWIRRFQVTSELFYAAYPDLSVVRIKQLAVFKQRFDAFVARVRSPTGARIHSIDDLFDEFLRENQQIAYGFPTPGGTY